MMQYIGAAVLPTVIFLIVAYGLISRRDIFSLFTSGAKEGLESAINLLPTLIALFVAVGMLRASGFFDLMSGLLAPILQRIGFPSEVLPLSLLRPVSGSGSLAIVNDIINQYGADSLAGRIASVMMGSTETTFYAMAVYFGSVRVKNTRYTLRAALPADLTGIILSVAVVKLMFS